MFAHYQFIGVREVKCKEFSISTLNQCQLYKSGCKEKTTSNNQYVYKFLNILEPQVRPTTCEHKAEFSGEIEIREKCKALTTEALCTAESAQCVYNPAYGIKFHNSGCKGITADDLIETFSGKTPETCDQACLETLNGKCVEF